MFIGQLVCSGCLVWFLIGKESEYFCYVVGYGFVDFERPSDAEKAAQHLQQSNIQAQMAKIRENSVNNSAIFV